MRARKGQNELRLVFWETTVGCNLRCAHCRAAAEPGRSPEELSTEEALAFVDDLAGFADPILILSGGEPLYRPDILEVATHASRQGFRVALATNGTLLDDAMAGKIASSGIQRVSISLDGVDAKVHDVFRGVPGAFDRAVAGIRHLKQHRVEVQINTTVTRHNMNDLPAMVALAEREEVIAFHLFLLVSHPFYE